MKKTIKICFIVFVFVFCLGFRKIPMKANSNEYTIDSYDIDMVVNENNTFEITEKITANFKVEKHGIYRKIPLYNKIERNDGTKSKNRAWISDISVSEKYKVRKENGFVVIKIGSSDKTYTGQRSYTIKYTYDIGKDPLKNADELYFNLIGNQWDTSISNVSFKITMPKAFDENLLGFSSGNVGSTDDSNVFYTVDENVISGYLTDTLDEEQGLTVRLTLPDGYFWGYKMHINLYAIVVSMICVLFVLRAYCVWLKFRNKDEVAEMVEYYPPEKMNPVEVSYLYEGKIKNQAMISLLFHLANKGYLKIEEIEEAGILSNKKSAKIIKIREYDGDNEAERLFFQGLFQKKGQAVNAIKASELYDRFYTTLKKIRNRIDCKENYDKIFDAEAGKQVKWFAFMIATIFILITTKPYLDYGELTMLGWAIVVPALLFSLLFATIFAMLEGFKLFNVFSILIMCVMFFAGLVYPSLQYDSMYMGMYGIGIVCVAFLMYFIKKMHIRNPYGNYMLAKTKGFRSFLENAEKFDFESVMRQNPQYYYDMLPYAYAFGVSDDWLAHLDHMNLQEPSWYIAQETDGPPVHAFRKFMKHRMHDVARTMYSSKSSSSSGGGGSSGGGSGGGGGSSW